MEWPDARCQMPDPRCQMPDPRSQIPDPRSQIPDARSQMPDPRSQIPARSSLHQSPVITADLIASAPLLPFPIGTRTELGARRLQARARNAASFFFLGSGLKRDALDVGGNRVAFCELVALEDPSTAPWTPGALAQGSRYRTGCCGTFDEDGRGEGPRG
ncbi:hypothetical protein MBM_02176 [Drepanopeziza brunnea f. sp. 'multigermtubi' MB_m1]|uniref:Uncharacterized protein n=1 Tax=Marssonina brunnea f. sp. multigermtubi (strain MB_m1) TaxID=1072389 RepID=K1Y513_MARBU|nr:uncharacterized protein MBM_02176 [Drepanopeziza brunnea f. sp. 'multigermtubi' MB_m1]EKD20224.1 hypothetical protein MBM_02176 [Drepanopeziza brunnea f. sp. 'multigermtubi' MB_m1]